MSENPLGDPIRREDWYYITKDSLVTCSVVVYPGEIVGVPEKTYKVLESGEIDSSKYRVGDNIYLVAYHTLVPLLEKNGFVRL